MCRVCLLLSPGRLRALIRVCERSLCKDVANVLSQWALFPEETGIVKLDEDMGTDEQEREFVKGLIMRNAMELRVRSPFSCAAAATVRTVCGSVSVCCVCVPRLCLL